jgi:hypothetical protein
MTVSQRRQQFLIGRQGSSGEELTPGSEPDTPRHVTLMGRRLLDREEEEEGTSRDIPQQLFAQNNNNNNNSASKDSGAVMLELEEQRNNAVRTELSAAMFQVRTVSLPVCTGKQYDAIHISEDRGSMFLHFVGYLSVSRSGVTS